MPSQFRAVAIAGTFRALAGECQRTNGLNAIICPTARYVGAPEHLCTRTHAEANFAVAL